MNNTIAVDQYGKYYPGLGKHPRKELLKRLGRKHAEKIYVDNGRHVGYSIAGLWLSIFTIGEWKGKDLS